MAGFGAGVGGSKRVGGVGGATESTARVLLEVASVALAGQTRLGAEGEGTAGWGQGTSSGGKTGQAGGAETADCGSFA